ncbi:serine kinase [bacterium]|nr:serine kinase [bacterium]MBR6463057.1 serine kinase [bacterium]
MRLHLNASGRCQSLPERKGGVIVTVAEFAKKYSLEVLSLPAPEREIKGGYMGDLLSWVMGRAKADQAWITIMSNQNIIAVATLIDFACIILAEDVRLEENLIETAKTKGVNILTTKLPAFEVACEICQEL